MIPSFLYIGPGMGAGTLALVIGIFAIVVLAFGYIVWYKVKRLLTKKKD
jgi:uncharacterized membrane protein YidH (DUF202 family)